MRIYTGSGDTGETSLYTGERVPKNSLRVETYGTVDELNAALGLARSFCVHRDVRAAIKRVQEVLVQAMAELATPGDRRYIMAEDVKMVEETIDFYMERTRIGHQFDIPGENQSSAALHVARTVARRAERLVCQLREIEGVADDILVLINRISDLCFVVSLFEAQTKEEV